MTVASLPFVQNSTFWPSYFDPLPAGTSHAVTVRSPLSSRAVGGSVSKKVAVISFSGHWCGPCVAETPDLVEANRQLRAAGKDVVFVGIATQDKVESVQAFVQARNVDYVIALDPRGVTGDSYGVLGLPATYIVDESGRVRRVIAGAVNLSRVLSEFK